MKNLNTLSVIFFLLIHSVSLMAQSETAVLPAKNEQGDEAGKERSYNQSEQEALNTLQQVSKGLQNLKKDVVTLNNDLRLMEEKLLFPSSTKFTVFVSLTTGQFFKLESIKLKIDGQLVTSHVYSDNQRSSMSRGGIQKLYVTNLNQGKHNVTVFFTGIGLNGRPHKLAETLDFEKGPAGEYLEVAIGDDGETQEPVFKLKRW